MSAAAAGATAGAGVGANTAAAPPAEEQIAAALQVVKQLVQTHSRLDDLHQLREMLENEGKQRLAQQARAIQAAADKGRPKKSQKGLRLEGVVTSERYQAALAAQQEQEAADALEDAAKKSVVGARAGPARRLQQLLIQRTKWRKVRRSLAWMLGAVARAGSVAGAAADEGEGVFLLEITTAAERGASRGRSRGRGHCDCCKASKSRTRSSKELRRQNSSSSSGHANACPVL